MKFLDKFELPRADPGTKEFPILDSLWPSTLICLGYLLFTLKLGPIYMRNRQPYNVKAFMLVYNIVQVIYNGIMFSYVCISDIPV
ncbi:PREDICTED: elongation of very long chain fatty acids protein AAEL008004-like [Drosophila arizonae]|uniref:Elongation of very long chain fatty acids protein AAEL008004-like n=1 Tax=Drosophila arizonae TaxID=7263 RepID=A0ABM1PFD3_DROAR|nr:PREDICTED: elongation of very long chain fatty acids protein AAEL008004-like [Drosophila arizonae]